MKNILIRSGISPLETFDAAHIINENSIGSNVGNLIYAYSIYRTLTTEDTTITPDYYSRDLKKADEINEKYDCYIIALADAFRPSFIHILRQYTKLIKKLKIPVIIVGVGLSADFEPDLKKGFPFDKDVKEFINAVLEKSNIVGVRGEITSQYLTQLGFREGIDHMVIGCPSMYAFGRELNIRDTNISKDSLVMVNSSLKSPEKVLNFISKSMKDFPNHYFIPQWRAEMMLTYLGIESVSKKNVDYPKSLSDSVYKNNRVRFFLNAPTWIDFMAKADFSFGARLHGNITATIAGTPSLIIPKDARMRELAEYHSLTSLWWNDINEDTELANVIASVDFKSPEKVQARNFDNYIDFLNKNKLEHIYKDNNYPSKIPLDDQLKQIDLKDPIIPASSIDKEELIARWEHYNELITSKQKRQIKKVKQDLKRKNKKVSHLEGTLNRKSVRLVLSAADTIAKKKK